MLRPDLAAFIAHCQDVRAEGPHGRRRAGGSASADLDSLVTNEDRELLRGLGIGW